MAHLSQLLNGADILYYDICGIITADSRTPLVIFMTGATKPTPDLKSIIANIRATLREPILSLLIKNSILTKTQIETLLVDLVLEDHIGSHISYEVKASLRPRKRAPAKGVSRGAFNRSLQQARRNLIRCFYTMLLLAYLGLFDYAIFRPFEEIASKIGNYRQIREILAGKRTLTKEEIESYRVTEETILHLLMDLSSPLSLKPESAKKR